MSDFPYYEAAAAAEHEQWMRWAKTLMKTGNLSASRIERWAECMVPYAELTDEMKEYDRVEARLLLDAVLGDEPLYRVHSGKPAKPCIGDNHGPFYQERGNVICARCTWTFAPLVQVWPEKNTSDGLSTTDDLWRKGLI